MLTRPQLITGFFLFSLFWQAAQAALPGLDAAGKPFPSLAPMLKAVNPAVVNISTYSTRQYNYNPLLNDPFFRRFFNLPEQQDSQPKAPRKQQQSAGSGVIVDAAKGLVITNYHVIKDADEVHVALQDGRSYQAKNIGSDPDLDIAILEINADGLTQVNIADSNQLEVGDFVVAIGNPFGLGQTVTTGIVSALGRSGLGIEGYENFIQTDASINPGNSGGALVNLAGELVGINTAIIAPAGGNVGIGFAIPTNMARASMAQIVKYGEVRRGQIGIGIQDITPQLREAFNLARGQFGVLVTNVVEGSPAQKAGMEAGDLVLAVDDLKVDSVAQLRSRLAIKTIDEKVRLSILRDGKNKDLTVKIGEVRSADAGNEELHPLLAGARLQENPEGEGVLVSYVAPNSSVSYSGLRAGDIIVGANKRRIYNMDALRSALRLDRNSVLLRVNRNGGSLYIAIR